MPLRLYSVSHGLLSDAGKGHYLTSQNNDVAQITSLPSGWCDVIGRGRMGGALGAALSAAGLPVRGPLGRGATSDDASVVLLCVPDREISAASAMIAPGRIVGHVSASAPLSLLEPHERFIMHPLLSVTGEGASFAGVTCAVDGSTPDALSVARALAERVGMRAREVPAEMRALYHAAASTAANYLTTLLGMAETLADEVGLDRDALTPLVRATVNNWATLGARAALTGPIARGDEDTVRRQRDAVAASRPDLLPFWDALVAATRELAGKPAPARA